MTLVFPPPGPLASPSLTVGLPRYITSAAVAKAMAVDFNTVVKITGREVFPEGGGSSMPLQATRFTFHCNNESDVKTVVDCGAKVDCEA